MTLSTQPLSTRPKQQDNAAVEAWLKENQPTILPSADRTAPRPVHTACPDGEVLNKARRVIKAVQAGNCTEGKFNGICGYSYITEIKVKRVLKENFGLVLIKVTRENTAGREMNYVEFGK